MRSPDTLLFIFMHHQALSVLTLPGNRSRSHLQRRMPWFSGSRRVGDGPDSVKGRLPSLSGASLFWLPCLTRSRNSAELSVEVSRPIATSTDIPNVQLVNIRQVGLIHPGLLAT